MLFSQTQSYLPANPKVVKCGVVIIKEAGEREMLVKIVGICEPIKTRVIKNGNRTYYEPVDIQNSVDIATIKTMDNSKYASGGMFEKTHNLLISAYSKPGHQQKMVISGEESIEHPFKFKFIKTERKWTSTFISGIYQNGLYTWKTHFAEFSVIKVDWLLVITLTFFFLALPLPLIYSLLSNTKGFPAWSERHKKLFDWLEDIDALLVWVVFELVALVIILFCQWIVFFICAAIITISVLILIYAPDAYLWVLRKRHSNKK